MVRFSFQIERRLFHLQLINIGKNGLKIKTKENAKYRFYLWP